MRVTKLIREYVEKSVGALPQYSTEKTPEEIAFEECKNKVSDFERNLEDSIKAQVEREIKIFREENNIPDDISIERSSYRLLSWSTYASEISAKAQTAKNNKATAKRKAIDEILLNLELGATKKELEEMIKALA